LVVAPESDPSAGWFRVPRSSQAYQISAFPTFKLYALPKQELGSVRGGNIEGIETLQQQAKGTIFDGAGNTIGGAAAEVREEKRREEKRREEKRREEKRREEKRREEKRSDSCIPQITASDMPPITAPPRNHLARRRILGRPG